MYRGSVGMVDTTVVFGATGLDVQLCKSIVHIVTRVQLNGSALLFPDAK